MNYFKIRHEKIFTNDFLWNKLKITIIYSYLEELSWLRSSKASLTQKIRRRQKISDDNLIFGGIIGNNCILPAKIARTALSHSQRSERRRQNINIWSGVRYGERYVETELLHASSQFNVYFNALPLCHFSSNRLFRRPKQYKKLQDNSRCHCFSKVRSQGNCGYTKMRCSGVSTYLIWTGLGIGLPQQRLSLSLVRSLENRFL